MSEPIMQRTVSTDGTEIAYWSSGSGPSLVLVHGALGDHTRWDVLRPHLESHLTVHAMDRRGRGGSGDGPEYSLQRESEDIAAVIDDVAQRTGESVAVYCSSFGGVAAFGAVPLSSHISRLALYEAWPPVAPEAMAPPDGFLEQVEDLLAGGEPEAALEKAYRDLVGISSEDLDGVRSQASWPARVAAAHTIPREERAFAAAAFDPDAAARITVPTLLLIGSESPIWGPQAQTVAAALPDARITTLDGQSHIADLVAPDLVAAALLPFFGVKD